MNLAQLPDTADRAGVGSWIDGDRGVDALLGEQTREHADLDAAEPGGARSDLHAVARLCARFGLPVAPGTTTDAPS